MTTKEKEQKILEAFGLKNGDKIVISIRFNKKLVLEILEREEGIYLESLENNYLYRVHSLIDNDWEKVKPPLKDKKCEDFDDCEGCPLIEWSCSDLINEDLADKTVGEVYGKIESKLFEAKQEIYGE